MGQAARPAIAWKGSPNYGYPDGNLGRNGYKPVAIVLHIMEGTLSGCDQHFNSPASEVSAHYGVGKNGEIHQYVREEDAAWANGIGYENGQFLSGGGIPMQPDSKVVQARPGINPNLYTISIEHEGKSGEPFTQEQVQATSRLIAYLSARWNIALDLDHVIGHCDINPVDKRNCPGTGCPFRTILAMAKAYRGSGTQQQEQPAPAQQPGIVWLGDFAHAAQVLDSTAFDPGEAKQQPVDGMGNVYIQVQEGTKRTLLYWAGRVFVECYPEK